ncbi:hypothetical protein [Verminephrobacter eiseniae]|uniref:hypothetical protein n=1 Tax=Verminephrobacter eiseniae TaxID=364317 RepID=UPI00223861E2|nr:hypothetical protein [Verminephrobacter eiseniae]
MRLAVLAFALEPLPISCRSPADPLPIGCFLSVALPTALPKPGHARTLPDNVQNLRQSADIGMGPSLKPAAAQERRR